MSQALSAQIREWFACMPAGQRQQLIAAGQRVWFWPGQIIVAQGAPVDYVVFIIQGAAEALADGDKQEGRRIESLGPGDIIGLASALDGGAHPATVRARDQLQVAAVPAEIARKIVTTVLAPGMPLGTAPWKSDHRPDSKPEVCTMLVAERNDVTRALLKRLLGKAGHVVMAYDRGEAVIDAWIRSTYDVVILGDLAPPFDAPRVAASIRAVERPTGRHTAIIAIGDVNGVPSFDAVLLKPVGAGVLTAAIHRVMHRSEP